MDEKRKIVLDLALKPRPDVVIAIGVADDAVGVRGVVMFQPVHASLHRVGRLAVRAKPEVAHAVEAVVRVACLLHSLEVEAAEEKRRLTHAPRDHVCLQNSSPCTQCELLAR